MDQSSARKTADEWEYQFGQLRRFKARLGHCRVPLTQPEYRPLAKWILWQREHHGRLSLDRLRCLHDFGFDFGRGESNWLARFFELADYKLYGTRASRPWSPSKKDLATVLFP